MSKKNNKSKFKAYGEYLKDQEKKEQERKLEKQKIRDTNRLAATVVDEINEITLNLEKDQKMTVEKPESKKKRKFIAKKKKRSN